MTQIKKYKKNGKGLSHYTERIKKQLNVSDIYYVPVCAFGIVYSVYSDKDCINKIAEIIY